MSYKKIELSEKDIERFWKYVNKKSDDECWEWGLSTDKDGYGRIGVKNKSYLAHRVSRFIHNGEIPEGLLVCHTCDNPACVNPHHLFVGTNKDNMDDRDKKGRGLQGTKNGRHKLTEEQVISVREKYVPHVHTLTMLAKEYGVSIPVIHSIVKGLNWKHSVEK